MLPKPSLTCIYYRNPYELIIGVAALANVIACQLPDDALGLATTALSQLGDTLATIAVQRSRCAQHDAEPIASVSLCPNSCRHGKTICSHSACYHSIALADNQQPCRFPVPQTVPDCLIYPSSVRRLPAYVRGLRRADDCRICSLSRRSSSRSRPRGHIRLVGVTTALSGKKSPASRTTAKT